MLLRSPHNSDLKGLRSMRNIEIGLSETVIAINFAKIGNTQDHTNFQMNYNLAKEIFEKEIIFEDIVTKESVDSLFFGEVKPFDEDISDSREVEFMRAQYSEYDGDRCIQMTLRNTMRSYVDISIDN